MFTGFSTKRSNNSVLFTDNSLRTFLQSIKVPVITIKPSLGNVTAAAAAMSVPRTSRRRFDPDLAEDISGRYPRETLRATDERPLGGGVFRDRKADGAAAIVRQNNEAEQQFGESQQLITLQRASGGNGEKRETARPQPWFPANFAPLRRSPWTC
jgi:hypothetical protein